MSTGLHREEVEVLVPHGCSSRARQEPSVPEDSPPSLKSAIIFAVPTAGFGSSGSRSTLVVAGVLMTVITAARLAFDGGPEAVSVFYVVPVALLASSFGVRGGAVGAGVAATLIVLFVATDERQVVGAVGIASRISAMVTVGLVVGSAVDSGRRQHRIALREQRARLLLEEETRFQVEAHHVSERARMAMEEAASRQFEAREINDRLLRRVVEAKVRLRAGDELGALAILSELAGSPEELTARLLPSTADDPPH